MRRFILFFAWIVSLPVLSGCTPVGVVVGAGAVAGSTALQERGVEQALKDQQTDLTIQSTLANLDFETFQRLSITVVEGRVLLTGIVPRADDRIQAVQVAWKTDGVVEVINEVLIGEDINVFNTGFDIKIEKALELALTLDRDVQAVNYVPIASGGTVHLIGIARSQAEIDRVIAHARDIERVRRIVSHVLLKDSPERAAVLERLKRMEASG